MLPQSGSTRRANGAALVPWILVAISFALVWRFDPDLYRYWLVPEADRDLAATRAWYQFLRSIGYLPLWLALGLALVLHQWSSRRLWDGVRIAFCAALTSGLAEGLRPLVGRLRPGLSSGIHKYHVQPDIPGAGVAYGFPSSHAAVAFGGAFMVFMLYPRAGLVAMVLAIACSWTRLHQGAHFASDVFASAILGYCCARLLAPRGPAR